HDDLARVGLDRARRDGGSRPPRRAVHGVDRARGARDGGAGGARRLPGGRGVRAPHDRGCRALRRRAHTGARAVAAADRLGGRGGLAARELRAAVPVRAAHELRQRRGPARRHGSGRGRAGGAAVERAAHRPAGRRAADPAARGAARGRARRAAASAASPTVCRFAERLSRGADPSDPRRDRRRSARRQIWYSGALSRSVTRSSFARGRALAGIPTTMLSAGASRITTAFAPTALRAPIVTGPSTLAPAPTTTPSCRVGWRLPLLSDVPPSVTPW